MVSRQVLVIAVIETIQGLRVAVVDNSYANATHVLYEDRRLDIDQLASKCYQIAKEKDIPMFNRYKDELKIDLFDFS